jgi:hypothetical protein
MNRLFEMFMFRLVDTLLAGSAMRVHYQRADRSIILNASTGQPYARVVPDILVERSAAGTTARLAIDAKYKVITNYGATGSLNGSRARLDVTWSRQRLVSELTGQPATFSHFLSLLGSVRSLHICRWLNRKLRGYGAANLLRSGNFHRSDAAVFDQERPHWPINQNKIHGFPARRLAAQHETHLPSLNGRHQQVRLCGTFHDWLHQNQSRFFLGVLCQEFLGIPDDHRTDGFRHSDRSRVPRRQPDYVHMVAEVVLAYHRLHLPQR